MVATAGMLNKDEVVAYVGANASKFGLDPVAVLAVADHEGLNTTPGSVWQLPKEWGKSFGPPSWYQGGAGGPIVTAQGSPEAASRWSWSPAGLDYWLQAVANSGAAGLTGLAAIKQIVGGYGWGFERPADPSADINNAIAVYDKYAKMVGDSVGQIYPPTFPPGPIPIPGQPKLPGEPQLPIPSNPQTPAKTTPAPKFSLPLFQLPTGPVNLTLPWDFSGILMFLAAIFIIIIGAILWKPSREGISNTVALAAA